MAEIVKMNARMHDYENRLRQIDHKENPSKPEEQALTSTPIGKNYNESGEHPQKKNRQLFTQQLEKETVLNEKLEGETLISPNGVSNLMNHGNFVRYDCGMK